MSARMAPACVKSNGMDASSKKTRASASGAFLLKLLVRGSQAVCILDLERRRLIGVIGF